MRNIFDVKKKSWVNKPLEKIQNDLDMLHMEGRVEHVTTR